ncbi:NAD(P)-binding protein [Limtongia smithiae]|uniref:NAD(P)-binding protein n=1 Tax=Limtongia smithiae TaxID=1125753 RepID=UPI0034CFF261
MSTSKQPRTVLVTGATGKQGSACVHYLLHSPEFAYNVLALTRKRDSPAARRLLAREDSSVEAGRLSIVECDLADEEGMRRVFEDARALGGENGWFGVFAVLAYAGLGADAAPEEKHARMLADLSLTFSASAFIYSTTLMPGPNIADVRDNSHRAKYRVEKYCQSLGEHDLNWAILRPGFFMENFDGFLGSMAVSVLNEGMGTNATIALIASDDIGKVAAGVFNDFTKYRHKILCVVAECRTMPQITAAYKDATTKPMPAFSPFLTRLILKFNTASQNVVWQLNRNDQVRSDGTYPEFDEELKLGQEVCALQSFHDWTLNRTTPRTPSPSTAGGGATRDGWNNLSIWKFATGRA